MDIEPSEADGWRSVANLINAHLQREGISLKEFAKRSGVSDTTLRPLLHDARPITRADKRAQLSIGLGLPPDGVDLLVEGLPGWITPRRRIEVDALEVELALEDLMRASLALRRVVAAGSPVEPSAEGHPPPPGPTQP